MDQIWREFPLRARRMLMRGQKSFRDKTTEVRADCALFHKPDIPLAVVEAKDNSQAMSAGVLEQTILKTWRVDTLVNIHPLIEAHRAELLNLARKRGVVGLRVFGSMSREDANDERDADLLVTLAPRDERSRIGWPFAGCTGFAGPPCRCGH